MPLDASPRMASPRSTCSILMTSAPQSDRSADAAGTKVCSATSRMRTPCRIAVIGLPPEVPTAGPRAAGSTRVPVDHAAHDEGLRGTSRNGDVAVEGALAGHAEHPLADHVAGHLGGAAADAGRPGACRKSAPRPATAPSSSVHAAPAAPASSKAIVLRPGRADARRRAGRWRPPGRTSLRTAMPSPMRRWRCWPTTLEHPGLADEVAARPGRRARPPPGRRRAPTRAVSPARAAADRDGDVRRVVQHALVEHPADADRPAVVDVADAIGVGDADVGHELLAELLRAVQHLDAVDLDARLVDREHEHREAAVLRHVPVRPGQAQAPVGPPRAGGPDLRAVEHPLVAVADGGGQRAGHVRAAARLGQELHPDLLALEDGGEVAQLLLLGAELEQDGGARRERRRLEPGRVLVAGQLLVERPLVRRGQALAAVLGRDADARRARRRRACAGARGRGRRRRAPPRRCASLRSTPTSEPASSGPEVGRGSTSRARCRKASTVFESSVVAHAALASLLDEGRRCAAGARPACRTARGRRCGAAGRGAGRARR